MFNNCGNSLIFIFLGNLPKGNILGPSLNVKGQVPKLGLSFSIVANLNNLKTLPLRPTRSWRKNTSPSPVNHKAKSNGTDNGAK
jgi:hypothetical protein